MGRSRSRSPRRDVKRRSRSRDRDRRRERRKSRSPTRRRRSRSPRARRSRSFSPRLRRSRSPREKTGRHDRPDRLLKDNDLIPQTSLNDRPELSQAELEGKTDEEVEMMKMMGFCGFETTKGKKVDGNDIYLANIQRKRRYRQYMNRKGGFNRPLDFIA